MKRGVMAAKTKVVAVGIKLQVEAWMDLDEIERRVHGKFKGPEMVEDIVVHPDPDVIFPKEGQ